MANAKKCDRCGKFYQELVNEKLKVRQYVNLFGGHTEYDLCPKCTEKLRAFLRFDRKAAKEPTKVVLDSTTISLGSVELNNLEMDVGSLYPKCMPDTTDNQES